MKIIGLTGGIASGKSTVTEYIAQKYHWPIIDADHLSHQISVQPEIKKQITAQFGALTRQQLSRLIFTDPDAKNALEKILHPPIIQAIKDQIQTLSVAQHAFVLLVAPLLIETELHQLCDEIIVLDLPPETQLQRLLSREPDLDPTLAQQIITAQTSPSKRNQFATFIIHNSVSPETLFSQVDQIVARLENT